MAIYFHNCSQSTENQVNEIYRFWKSSRRFWTLSTSGSTGKPSSVELSRSALKASAQATLDHFGFKTPVKALLCLPPNKVGGMMMVIRALVGDWELWVTEPTAQPLRGFQSDFDFVSMVPYQASRSRQDLSKVNTLLLGGGMISSELRQHLASSLNTSVYQSYGMTETLSHVALRKLGGDAVNPPYRALPGVSFARDSRACLIIDAPDREVKGLVTNDLVELVDTQSFYYLGRYDNVINSGGWKLHPEQLESQLQSFASNLALVGLPDPLWGEKMVLVVERERPLTKVEQEVLVEKLKGPERPKAFYVIPHFPYTSNGKLQRGRLRQLIQDQKSKTANN